MKAKYFGCELLLDEQDSLGLASNRLYEPHITSYLNTTLESGDVFVDIGAHIGYYTLLASKRVGWKGHVYAFEPYPDHFATLKRNVRQNRRKRNVTLERAAVMDFSADHSVLYLSKKNVADHRTCYNEKDREIIPVKYVTLDDYFLPQMRTGMIPNKVDVIKLDIQGSEPYALMGMTELLNRNPDLTIVTEFWPEGIRQAGSIPTDYLGRLEELGFTLHTMDREPREPQWIMNNVPGGWQGFYPGLLCVRNDEA